MAETASQADASWGYRGPVAAGARQDVVARLDHEYSQQEHNTSSAALFDSWICGGTGSQAQIRRRGPSLTVIANSKRHFLKSGMS